MSGLETIIKYSCLSDEQRWFANRYEMSWLDELSESDKAIVKLLDCLPDGEFSGQASAVQMYELLFEEKNNGFPPELIEDWGQILAYFNIIVYEEMRHGLILGKLTNFVKTGSHNYFQELSTKEYSKNFIWCYEERRFWDLYSYLLCHLFGEVINTELYRDVKDEIEHVELKNVISNVMKDEARHTSAWTALIKDLIVANPVHKERALKTLDRALLYHNAMSHKRFFEGQNKMLTLFKKAKSPSDTEGTIERIIAKKLTILDDLFGDDHPYDKKSLKDLHMGFLAKTMTAKTAKYTDVTEDNLELA